MSFVLPDTYVAERMRIAEVAAEWRRLTLWERRERVVDNVCKAMRNEGSKSLRLRASGASAEPKALGLVSNATTRNSFGVGQEKRPLRERFKIDRDAARCKRMRVRVSNAARLLHRQAHMERAAQRWNLKFVTLTYRDAKGWRPGHLENFRANLRAWCAKHRVRCRVVWVAELQERGAVHYHMVVWLPKGKFLPAPDKGQRHAWWPHGSTNIQTAQNPIGYLMKYASKATAASAADYPRGCRMFGTGGLDKAGREEVRYWGAPAWVRDAMPGTADIRKVVGGYVDAHTGEFLRSPWRVFVGPDGQPWAFKVDQLETMQ